MPEEAARPRTAASDGTAIFQPIFDQSRIAVIDLKAGRRRWSFEAKGWIYGAPTVTEDRVFFGSQDNHLYCLDKRRKTSSGVSPRSLGSRPESPIEMARSSSARATVASTGSMPRRAKRSGAIKLPMTKGASTAIYSAPLCTEDAVYFGSFDGHLYCLKIANGAIEVANPAGEGLGDHRLPDDRRSANRARHAAKSRRSKARMRSSSSVKTRRKRRFPILVHEPAGEEKIRKTVPGTVGTRSDRPPRGLETHRRDRRGRRTRSAGRWRYVGRRWPSTRSRMGSAGSWAISISGC